MGAPQTFNGSGVARGKNLIGHRSFSTMVAATLLWAVVLNAACGPQARDFAALRGDTQYNVVIVTLDTTRADRIGAYGFDNVSTPFIDSLADRGVTFLRAYAVTPLTLPSHTSILSGTYPPNHGVRDNGAFVVSEELETLAEVLAAQGYDTGAFVASFVLDSRWGLDQGFDTYFDDFEVPNEKIIALGSIQRPGNEVIDAALDWLDREAGAPFFLWVHLYDPHTPYEAPEPFATRYSQRPYVAEIAFVDSQIGRLIERLEEDSQLDETIIVLSGDHGEALREHGEIEHGFFIYEEGTHVPLIFSLPFGQLQGRRVEQPVSIVDIMPTLLEMTGIEVPTGVQAKSLAPYMLDAGEPPDDYVYTESYYARYHFGWGELKAIQDERYKLILSSDPELYDLTTDPEEADNLVGVRNSVFQRLSEAADGMIARLGEGGSEASVANLDEETRQRLAALGYLSTFANVDAEASGDLESPRNKIEVYNSVLRARALMLTQQYDKAEAILVEVLDSDPGLSDVYQTLGNLYNRQERFQDAADAFRSAIPLKPNDPTFYLMLANAQLSMGQSAAAEQTALDSLEFIEPDSRIYFLLGNIQRQQQDYRQAIEHFHQVLALNKDAAGAHQALGAAYFALQENTPAEEHLLQALELDDSVPEGHFVLGQILDLGGRLQEAIAEYRAEIENNPDHLRSNYNLAAVFRKLENTEAEERHLQRVLEISPEFPLAKLFLARIYLRRGVRYQEAVEMVSSALEHTLEVRDEALGYFLLADLYNRLGNDQLSRQYATRARQVVGEGAGGGG